MLKQNNPSSFISVTFFLLVMVSSNAIAGAVIHVDADAPGPNDGTGWAYAYKNIEIALTVAPPGAEIHVAEGTYMPTTKHGGLSDRHNSYQMKNGVKIMGGYAGYGQPDPDLRDPKSYETIFSGNIANPKYNSDNCYHVFYHPYSLELDSTAVLDGCTIKDGNADFAGSHAAYGGGMYNDECLPTVRNCIFEQNNALQDGGGMFNKNYAHVTISDTRFTDNSAKNGGAVSNLWHTNPTITDCTFARNRAEDNGGGVANHMNASPRITNCVFAFNKATADFSDGGGLCNSSASSPIVVNCLFYYNYAYRGGGMLNSSDCNATVLNCTFYANWAVEGGGIYNYYSSPAIVNSILWINRPDQIYNKGGTPVVSYCDVFGNYEGKQNIFSNPKFIKVPVFCDWTTAAGTTTTIKVADISPYSIGDTIELDDITGHKITAISAKGNIITFTPALKETSTAAILLGNWGDGFVISMFENFHIRDTSPCIDRGINNVTQMPEYDIDYNGRIIDGDDNGTAVADMGYDEYFDGLLYVDADATGAATGYSWEHAFTDLQDALNIAAPGDRIWVAEGTYSPAERVDPAELRSTAFQLINNVAVYGGFDPTVGHTEFDQRDPQNDLTILSGELGSGTPLADYSYHVFYHPPALNLNASAVLDGFTIRNGYAHGAEPDNQGGGMYNNLCSPTIENCTFIANNASLGAGMYNELCSPALNNCVFGGDAFAEENTATLLGGGMYNFNAAPTLIDCIFEKNKAYSGGGIYNDSSSPQITRCLFDGNTVLGTYEYNKGGGICNANASAPTITESTFASNRALSEAWGKGGGLYCDATSAPTISQCYFDHNVSFNDGGALYCDGASPTVNEGTILYDNQALHGDGGAIFCIASAAPDISDCNIVENFAAEQGGGVYIQAAAPIIHDCLIADNEAVQEGGGLACYEGADPTITDCIIRANYTTMYSSEGGGVFVGFAEPLFEDCSITENIASVGGAISVRSHADASFNNCTITDNTGTFDAGGVLCHDSRAQLINCVISNNSADRLAGEGWGGGVLAAYSATIDIINCTVYGNEAASRGGGIIEQSATVNLHNSIVWANLPDQIADIGGTVNVSHSDVQDGYTGTANLDTDPLFADPDNGVFYLTPDSECIDTADNAALPVEITTDLAGNNRFIDGDDNGSAIVDMGAYEFSYASIGSFDGDSDVDGRDFSIFSDAWMTRRGDPGWNPDCDISRPADNKIDLRDLLIVSEYWMFGK